MVLEKAERTQTWYMILSTSLHFLGDTIACDSNELECKVDSTFGTSALRAKGILFQRRILAACGQREQSRYTLV